MRQETFFNFFSPPTAQDEDSGDEEDEEEEGLDEKLEADYGIGEMIKDEIVPNAIEWFTGDALQDYDDEEYSDEYGSDEDDDDEDEDDDEEDDAPPARGAGRGRGAPPGAARPECKQQ